MDSQKNKVMCFSLVDTDHEVVIPEYKETVTSNGDAMVKWGADNLYPNLLRTMVKESVSATSVVNGTAEYMKGLKYEFNLSGNIEEECVNRDNDTIMDLIDACVKDQIIFGGYCIQVIYNKLGQIAELYNIPMDFIRMNEDRTKFFFSKKWTKYSSKSLEYPKFNTDENKELVPSEVFCMNNAGRSQVYPLSNFTSVLFDMYSEGVASKYIAKTLDGGISARYVISLPNAQNLSDQQKQDIEDGIREKFAGVNNAGSYMLYFNSGEEGLEVEKIEGDDSGDTFNAISDAASLHIYKAMHCTPNIMGDPSHSTGFNEQEYEGALKLFKKMTLIPLARVIERGFNQVLGKNAIKITVE
jgi:hypothetical protein